MTINDYEAVYSLWNSCAGMGLYNINDSKEGIAKFLLRNPDTCLVSEIDSIITGVILAGNDGRRGYIYHTAVHPDYRKQGIGKKLVDYVLKELFNAGIIKVACVAFKRNNEGYAFWKSQGFTVRDDLVYQDKALTEIVRMDT